MKKVINHKGWLTAILSIIPFFIFVSFFQGFGVGLSNVLGKRGIIDFDFDKYLEIEAVSYTHLTLPTMAGV